SRCRAWSSSDSRSTMRSRKASSCRRRHATGLVVPAWKAAFRPATNRSMSGLTADPEGGPTVVMGSVKDTSSSLPGFGLLDDVGRGNAAHAPFLEVLEGLRQLGPRVHDERAVMGDRLTDRAAPQDEHVQVRGSGVLDLVRLDPDGVTGAE